MAGGNGWTPGGTGSQAALMGVAGPALGARE